jgi:predicted nucleic acid-binding protein
MGRRKILESNYLIDNWRKHCKGGGSDNTIEDARIWARTLIQIRKSNFIVTPVAVEFLVGVRSSHELKLALSYLGEFYVVDRGNIPKADWDEARRIAQRVPHDRRPRDLGDCLIKAIAVRMRYDVDTQDTGFP